MSDPGSLERYCSSYYDKHGLYNDGFPCPMDKYCCQTSDGTKMCCSVSDISNSKLTKPPQTTQSFIISTISNKILNKNSYLESFINSNNKYNSISDSSSFSLPFLFSNSNLLITISASIGVLLLIAFVLLVLCMCRCCLRRSPKTTNGKKGERKTKHISSYSRNSSSSCNSTTVTSSASTSPKTNELTVCCDDEDDEHQKILTIDPSVSHGHHLAHSRHLNENINTNSISNSFMMNNHSSGGAGSDHIQRTLLSNNLANLNSLYSQTNYINAISSGSSSICASNAPLLHANLNSANSTHSSFLTNNSQQQYNNLNNLTEHSYHLNAHNTNLADLDFDEQNENEEDFIVSTSSNLEFLKAHSLFNTTPLNYYPTLNMKLSLEEPQKTEQQANLANSSSNQINANSIAGSTAAATSSNAANLLDYRFSTFLPPLFVKNNELI